MSESDSRESVSVHTVSYPAVVENVADAMTDGVVGVGLDGVGLEGDLGTVRVGDCCSTF